MRIQIISDVHCEFHGDKGKEFSENLPMDGDALVIAGDFGTYNELYPALSTLAKRGFNILFTPGNHEYYASNRGNIHLTLNKLQRRFDNFHFLYNNIAVINGQRFLGTPLWWNAYGVSPVDMMTIRNALNDFRMIQGYERWIGRENLECVDFLRKNIQEGDIVLTHHAPSWQSRDPSKWYRGGGALDHCYYNDLDNLIFEKRAKLWIHGHTHDLTDYNIGETRVVSFPHGYAMNGGYNTGRCWLDRYGAIEV